MRTTKATTLRDRGYVEDLAVATLAGDLGTTAMEPVSMKLYELESADDRAREDHARPGPPYRIAAQKTAHLLGLHPDEQQLDQAALVFHYGLAVSWAPVYAYLRRRRELGAVPAGLVLGTAMSLIADETITPWLGFSAPDRAYPLSTHLRGARRPPRVRVGRRRDHRSRLGPARPPPLNRR